MKRRINYYFLFIVISLIIFGLLFLATLSAPASLQIFGNTNYYLFRQFLSFVIGLILGFVAFKTPLNFFKKIALPLLIINLLILVLVFLPGIGVKFWGAQRWIGIGKNTFQPSEFLKITAILYLAALISSKFSVHSKRSWILLAKKGYHNFIKVFLPFFFLLAIISAILILQPDISTMGVLSISLIALYFSARTPIWHTILTALVGVMSALLLVYFKPYRAQRLLVFFNPETDPLGIGFQLKQSLLALGSGGIFGKGLGMSTQKFGFLPQAMSDSTFAVLGEEAGIIGASVLVLLYLLFFWQGIRISSSASDKFAKLTAVGITVWITSQAFINIASTIGIFPLSGIPLPFFSYGGSHIIAEMIGVGILLNISKNG